MILDLDRLRMEYAKIYQVQDGSARREPLGGSLSWSEPSGLGFSSGFMGVWLNSRFTD
jgi:hypothetical protein